MVLPPFRENSIANCRLHLSRPDRQIRFSPSLLSFVVLLLSRQWVAQRQDLECRPVGAPEVHGRLSCSADPEASDAAICGATPYVCRPRQQESPAHSAGPVRPAPGIGYPSFTLLLLSPVEAPAWPKGQGTSPAILSRVELQHNSDAECSRRSEAGLLLCWKPHRNHQDDPAAPMRLTGMSPSPRSRILRIPRAGRPGRAGRTAQSRHRARVAWTIPQSVPSSSGSGDSLCGSSTTWARSFIVRRVFIDGKSTGRHT